MSILNLQHILVLLSLKGSAPILSLEIRLCSHPCQIRLRLNCRDWRGLAGPVLVGLKLDLESDGDVSAFQHLEVLGKDGLLLYKIVVADIPAVSLELVDGLPGPVFLLDLEIESIDVETSIDLETQANRVGVNLGQIEMNRWLYQIQK